MRSLIEIITSVLNSEEHIPALPDNQLIAFENKGQPIPAAISQKAFHQIARLQTLIIKEQEKAKIPEMDTLNGTSARLGQDFGTTLASSLAVQEDAELNVQMLERLIVEIVRAACPPECERFGVVYFADVSLRVFFSEAPRQRFLD